MDLPTTDAPLVTAVPQAVQQDDQAIGGKTDGDKLMKAELARPLHYLIGESKDDECFAAEEMKTEADELQAAGEEKKAEEKMKGDEQAEEKNDEDEDTASRSQDYQDNEALVSRLLAETDETDFEDSDDREFELNGDWPHWEGARRYPPPSTSPSTLPSPLPVRRRFACSTFALPGTWSFGLCSSRQARLAE